MRLLLLLASFFSLLSSSYSLYFYLEGSQTRCFLEDLPKDTLVVGTFPFPEEALGNERNTVNIAGHFKAEEWNSETSEYAFNPNMGVKITVDEIFDNDHRVISQKSNNIGRFTFTAAESGEHKLCFQTMKSGGWFSSSYVRLHLDLAIGETGDIDKSNKDQSESLAQRVKELNARLLDIRREQVFQREREAEFRDQSESANSRVVRWTILQLVVLGATCAWQLNHLKGFFQKAKLV